MSRILWIGSYLNNNQADSMINYGYTNSASITSQRNILLGIKKNINNKIDIISAISLKGFPSERKIIIPKITETNKNGTFHTVLGFWNFKYLNKVFLSISMHKAIRKYLKKYKDEKIDVFIYEMRSVCMSSTRILKNKHNNLKIHLIVPDLPSFMDLNQSKFKRALKKIDWFSMQKCIKYVDDFILYSSMMADYLKLATGRWMLMEGSYDSSERIVFSDSTKDKKNKYVVLYSGSLNKGYGILNLIEAFSFLPNNFELWLCGSGDLSNMITNLSDHNLKVRFFGFLPNRDDVIKLQSISDLLIDIRDPNNDASKYCFPSKIFEYLTSGKPVLSSRIQGIPDEYFDYLIPLDNINPKYIASKIEEVSKMNALDVSILVNKNAKFIEEHKNNIVQAKKILTFTGLS